MYVCILQNWIRKYITNDKKHFPEESSTTYLLLVTAPVDSRIAFPVLKVPLSTSALHVHMYAVSNTNADTNNLFIFKIYA